MKNNNDKNHKLVQITIKTHADKNGGHPHAILDNVEDKHVSIGFTTKKKKGKNATNYKLEVNPLGKNKQAYMRRQGTVAPINEYSTKSKKGSMTEKDYKRAKEYGDKAKLKHLEKRQ